MNSRYGFCVLTLTLLFSSCSLLGVEEDEPPSYGIVPAEMGDMTNIGVCGEVWIGEQPSKAALDIVSRRGFRTLISLLPTGAPADQEIAAECRRMGIAFIPICVDDAIPNDRDVDRVMEALNMEGRGLALLYCETGSQAMMFFAIHRAVFQGIPINAALEEARRGGMTPGQADLVRAQIGRLTV